jgi:hypothetical protein
VVSDTNCGRPRRHAQVARAVSCRLVPVNCKNTSQFFIGVSHGSHCLRKHSTNIRGCREHDRGRLPWCGRASDPSQPMSSLPPHGRCEPSRLQSPPRCFRHVRSIFRLRRSRAGRGSNAFSTTAGTNCAVLLSVLTIGWRACRRRVEHLLRGQPILPSDIRNHGNQGQASPSTIRAFEIPRKLAPPPCPVITSSRRTASPPAQAYGQA